ncbi:MAG TPA: hypothetical protein PK031_02250 [Pseudomonadales bacterium]|nr:hypothetical protein [Pseudomonadales bacterium]
MSATLFPEFFVQCCDASNYLDLGNACASANNCYGELRPGGAYYWFSWPVRLGLSSDALIYANFLLLLLSAFLAAGTLLLINRRAKQPGDELPKWMPLILCTASIAIHLVFFWPTIFTSLSDPPATLFLLNGFWLLLIACLKSSSKKIFFLITGSLCLGLSAWIRAFYFYPLLAGIAICCIAILIYPRRNFVYALILCALIPPGFQFANTYAQSGKWSYFNTQETSNLTSMHLTSMFIGYDTLLPASSYFSQPQYCQIRSGILASLQEKDYSSLLCLMSHRIGFYLATYRSSTFIYPTIHNRLAPESIENIGSNNAWENHYLAIQANVTADPFGGITAEKLMPEPHVSEGPFTSQHVALHGNTDYTFSIWLWSDKPINLQLLLKQYSSDTVISSAIITLTQQPQRFHITGKTLGFGEYSASIETLPSGKTVSLHPSAADAFYAWGAQLEEGAAMTEYAGIEPLEGNDIRGWHLWLLLVNGVALTLALLYIIRFRQIWLYEPAGLAVTAIAGAVFAEALIIIPEQRFCAAFIVLIWLLASGYVFSALTRQRTGANP